MDRSGNEWVGEHGKYLLVENTILVVLSESKGCQDESSHSQYVHEWKPFPYTTSEQLSTNSFHNQDRNIWAQARSGNAADQ